MYQSTIKSAKKRVTRDYKNRELEFPDTDQEFGVIESMLGNGRCKVIMPNGTSITGIIAGSMRKQRGRVIILKNDLVIVSIRDFDKSKVDIIYKYTHDETGILLQQYRDLFSPTLLRAIQEVDQHSTVNEDDNVVFEDREVKNGDQSTSSKYGMDLLDDEGGSDEDGAGVEVDIDAI